MRRICITLMGWLAMVAVAHAGTFHLADGTTIVGTPDSINDKGVVFALDGGEYSPRTDYDKFTPEALKELMAEAKTDADRAKLEPLIETIPQEPPKPKEVVFKAVQTPDRPKHSDGIFALFGSPVGWLIVLVLYGANLYAAYEVCVYRHQPLATVCGLAAIPFLGVLSPIIYGAMPTQYRPAEPVPDAPVEEAPGVSEAAAGGSAPTPAPSPSQTTAASAPAAAPAWPEPVVYKRGDFSFNRRFFETKFSGFFRVIPTEADKDLVLVVQGSRGQFIGTRISRVTANEVYLQVVNNNVSADEMIPFAEIDEVQIRHKDTL